MPYTRKDFSEVDFDILVFKESAIPKTFQDFKFGKKVVVCFELFNNGCNTDILIGRGRAKYPIPSGQGKTFGLDGMLRWTDLNDKQIEVKPSRYKVTDCDNKPLKEEKELILIYYFISC